MGMSREIPMDLRNGASDEEYYRSAARCDLECDMCAGQDVCEYGRLGDGEKEWGMSIDDPVGALWLGGKTGVERVGAGARYYMIDGNYKTWNSVLVEISRRFEHGRVGHGSAAGVWFSKMYNVRRPPLFIYFDTRGNPYLSHLGNICVDNFLVSPLQRYFTDMESLTIDDFMCLLEGVLGMGMELVTWGRLRRDRVPLYREWHTIGLLVHDSGGVQGAAQEAHSIVGYKDVGADIICEVYGLDTGQVVRLQRFVDSLPKGVGLSVAGSEGGSSRTSFLEI